MVIADWLDRMKTGNNQFPGRYEAGASSEPSVAVFHSILDYQELKNEKDGALKHFED